jgi:hypothetical protein
LEIEFYLIYLSLLVRVGIDKGISSPHEQLDLFQFDLINKQEGPVVKPGDDVCIPRSADLLESLGSPGGLLPFKDIQECGFDKTTGLGDVGIPSLGFLCKLHITLFWMFWLMLESIDLWI